MDLGKALAANYDHWRIGASPWFHDDVIKWKHFPRYWPFVREKSLVTDEFPVQRPVSRSFDIFFDLRLELTVE